MGPARTNWLLQLLLVFSCCCVQALAGGLCENSPTSRRCWGEYNITTDYSVVTPDTGVTREVGGPLSYWKIPAHDGSTGSRRKISPWPPMATSDRSSSSMEAYQVQQLKQTGGTR